MDLEPLLKTIEIDEQELGTFDGLIKVMPSVMVQYATYWLRTPAKNAIIIVSFRDIDEQMAVLKPIVRMMNKASAPDHDLLDRIPRRIVPLTEIHTFHTHVPDIVTKEMISAVTMYKQDVVDCTLLIVAAPYPNKEGSLWACLMPLSTASVHHYIEKEAPEFVNWLKTRDVTDFDPKDPKDADIRAEIRKNLAQKRCACCLKENATKRCAICSAYYCNPDCQQKDWKKGHKLICKTLRYLKVATVNGGLYDD